MTGPLAQRYNAPYATAFDTNGITLPGALLYFYVTSTTTPANTYEDDLLVTPNSNPVVANGAGLFPSIFLIPGQLYKVVLTDSTGDTIWTADPVFSEPGGALVITSSSANALSVGPNGTTNPTFNVDASASSCATGVDIVGAAAGSGVAIKAISSGTNENLTIAAKGLGTVEMLSPVGFLAGTAGAPGIYFGSETNTGLWRVASGFLDFTIVGTDTVQMNNHGITVIPGGSATGVSYAVGGDVTTGMYSNAVGDIDFAVVGVDVAQINSNGFHVLSGAGTGTTAIIDSAGTLRPQSSSERFKDVTERGWKPTPEMVQSFLAVSPIGFNYKGGKDHLVGFSAEDVAKVDPQLVNMDKDGKPMSLREHAILAYHHTIIAELREEIAALKSRLN